jgi:hypothetical protein
VNRVIDAKGKADLAKNVLESFRHKRDMLIQVGADMREEFKGQMRMKSGDDLNSKIDSARRKVG